MVEIYNKELNEKLKNVNFNKKTVHIHNISCKDANLMYKNFYESNNFNSIKSEDIELDNLTFSMYENWLVGSDEY